MRVKKIYMTRTWRSHLLRENTIVWKAVYLVDANQYPREESRVAFGRTPGVVVRPPRTEGQIWLTGWPCLPQMLTIPTSQDLIRYDHLTQGLIRYDHLAYSFLVPDLPPCKYSPENMIHWNIVFFSLAHRLRRWPNIKKTLFQFIVYAGIQPCISKQQKLLAWKVSSYCFLSSVPPSLMQMQTAVAGHL